MRSVVMAVGFFIAAYSSAAATDILLQVTRKPAFAIEVMRVLARRLRAADHDLAVPGIAATAPHRA